MSPNAPLVVERLVTVDLTARIETIEGFYFSSRFKNLFMNHRTICQSDRNYRKNVEDLSQNLMFVVVIFLRVIGYPPHGIRSVNKRHIFNRYRLDWTCGDSDLKIYRFSCSQHKYCRISSRCPGACITFVTLMIAPTKQTNIEFCIQVIEYFLCFTGINSIVFQRHCYPRRKKADIALICRSFINND